MRLRSPRFLCSRKFWQRSLFAIASLATLIAAFYAIENARGHAAWMHYRKDAITRGMKLDWKEFIPAPIPDEENFAAIPIMRERMSPDPSLRAAQQNRLRLPDAKSWGNGRIGKQVEFAAWQECFSESGMLSAKSDNPAADLLRALERYEPILNQFRAAMSRPQSQLVSDWEKGYEADFWRLGNQVEIGRIFSLRINGLLATGRSEEALADWRVQLRHADILHNSPTLLAGMLRVMLLTMAVNTAWQGIAGEQWNDAELAEIESALRPIDLVASYVWVIQSERAGFNFQFEKVRRDPASVHEFLIGGLIGGGWTWGFVPTGWVDQNLVRINQWYDANILEAEQMKSGVALQKAPRRIHGWRPYWFISDTVIYFIGGNRDTCVRTQAEVELCRVACALKRFQLRNGRYPESLDELRPALLPAIPADRIDGQLLRYRRTDDGLVLYSVGEDRHDDDGDDTKDIAWRVPTAKRSE